MCDIRMHGHKVLAIYSDENNKYIALRLDTNNTGTNGFIVAFGPIKESGVMYSPSISEPVKIIFSATTKDPVELNRIDLISVRDKTSRPDQNNP